ncbi:hypothetical protein, partial [Salmonella enterica]|uniref:hypothetical protein n=1 Tax=Salmonella enterica TaxID=28901 RepID=UPI003D766809
MDKGGDTFLSRTAKQVENHMNQSLLVTKRDARTVRINLDKIHRVLDWAAEGL